ncbi:transglutaminase-like domain-containing protein [Kangiella koreensis]|uniref:Transglutaminase domain protein n=1 Tax=Kangiella koreensis (strain DSM 16069 / JCM 12317 / KCTC 12182 / SW-125) TaxID=523791 RepID=C7RC22_KANKD|nr:transglutaminase-like domain-containing protein [Kangiella koreensis]ACV26814.1 transglutaminase domain protein [Kangiella koreensis DSM 16069]
MMRPTTQFKHRSFTFCVLILAVAALLWLGLRESSPKYRYDLATIEPFKQWYQINWHNQAVGRASVELLEQGDQYTVIEDDFMEGRVQGRRFQFRYVRELYFANQAPYELLGGRLYSEEPQLRVETSFINDEELTVTENRNDKSYRKTLPPVDYHLSDYIMVSSLIEQSVSIPAGTFDVKSLNTRSFEVETSHYQVLKPKSSQSYIALQQKHPNNEISWHRLSKEGQPKLHTFSNGMEYVASSRQVTLSPEMQSDLYLNSGVAVDKPLGGANNIQSLTLGLQNGRLDWFEHYPTVTINDDQQTIQLKPGSRYKASSEDIVSIGKGATKRLNPIARELALEAVSKSNNDWQKVETLVSFVYGYLNYQPVPAGFNIDDILDNKIGDCTEYAQLLIEMLSAAQVPAREVNGLVYLGDHEKRFGGHVWVEVLVDGHWIAVDPTWNLTQVTSTHIPVAINLDGADFSKTNDRFAFRVEEIHYKGETTDQTKRL